jgi:hypothetical protein
VAESKPSAFPVLVCEKPIPPSARRAAIAGRALPLPKASPRRIVVLGDTGCRIKTSDRAFQACNDTAQWPFAAVAGAASDARPDLVIHVGDYHYRENACPDGNPGCAGSPWGYGWDAWEADLFAPAERLMRAAPWIVVRGNHESCHRAGQGWWRFLDPRPLAPGQDCNAAATTRSVTTANPTVLLGLRMVTPSSSCSTRWLCAPLPPDDPMHPVSRAARRARAAGGRTRFLNHHLVSPSRPTREARRPFQAALQSVLQAAATALFRPA